MGLSSRTPLADAARLGIRCELPFVETELHNYADEKRVVACFKALATGDAVAKQTETLPYAEVRKWYPGGISGFHGPPGEVIPRYRGRRYPWRIGETTDDTEQTLAVTRSILRIREVRHDSIGLELLTCRKSLHPGVSLWSFVQTGDACRIAPDGDGCGAAMRVSPVGLFYRSTQMEHIVRGAYECAISTHGGQAAICAAAAVAAAVSGSVDGCSPSEVLDAAMTAAKAAEALTGASRPWTIADSLAKIHADLSTRRPLTVDYVAERYFPSTPETIVPLAISLALITESAEQTVLIAANVGGDSDSVASIGSAIAAALRPETVNEDWFDVVRSVNQDDVVQAAVSLAAVRR